MIVDELSTDNTRGNSHNGVTQKHDQGAEETAHWCHGGDVTVAHGGHRDHGPIDTGGNVRELCAGLMSLDHIHEGAQRDDHDDYEEKENEYLAAAHEERLHQAVALLQEAEELEHTEDTDEAERADYHEIAHRAEDPSQIERQRAEQVNNAEETEYIVAWTGRAIEAAYVFECEEDAIEAIKGYMPAKIQERNISALLRAVQEVTE